MGRMGRMACGGGASRTLGRRGSAFGVRVGVGRLRVRLGFARAFCLRLGLGEVLRAGEQVTL